MFGSGHSEYDDEQTEVFDLDLRNPDVDGVHAFAAGYMILGNWQNRGDMQFRGTIHHVELYDSSLADYSVTSISAAILATGNAPPAVRGDFAEPIVAVDVDTDSGTIQISGSAVATSDQEVIVTSIHGAPSITEGPFGLQNAISFDIDDWLQLGDTGILTDGSWTIDTWVKSTPDSYAHATPSVLVGGYDRDLRVAVEPDSAELGAVSYASPPPHTCADANADGNPYDCSNSVNGLSEAPVQHR
jgi:hypothetical protein